MVGQHLGEHVTSQLGRVAVVKYAVHTVSHAETCYAGAHSADPHHDAHAVRQVILYVRIPSQAVQSDTSDWLTSDRGDAADRRHRRGERQRVR